MNRAILTSSYLPCIQFFSKLVSYNEIQVEQFDHFNKQTYRNRCKILGANGVQSLNIPVEKARNRKMLMRDVRISYDTQWQKQHWKSIVSAYNSSPFFEYYADVLEPFYNENFEYLFDFNQQLLNVLCEEIEIDVEIVTTDDFILYDDEQTMDYRAVIHPKPQRQLEDKRFEAKPYTQVFSHKAEFEANLSIIDLLFNKGPETLSFLEECAK